MSKFLYEASNALSGASSLLTLIIRDVLQIVALLAVLVWQDWRLTAVTLLLAPFIAIILRWVSRRHASVHEDDAGDDGIDVLRSLPDD